MSETEATTAREVTFGGGNPIFRVRDVSASVDHYVRVLGFKVDWEDPGTIVSVSRGGFCVFLSQGDQGHPGAWAWVGVNDAQALYEEYRASGARIRNPPQNFAWALEMQVEDLDGNVLRLGSHQREGEPFGRWRDMRGDYWEMRDGGGWARVEDPRPVTAI